MSFALDVKILVKTIVNVLSGTGVNSGEQSTMEKFKGTVKKGG